MLDCLKYIRYVIRGRLGLDGSCLSEKDYTRVNCSLAHALNKCIRVANIKYGGFREILVVLSSKRQRVYTELGDRKRDCNEICGSSDKICTLILPITIISGSRHALI